MGAACVLFLINRSAETTNPAIETRAFDTPSHVQQSIFISLISYYGGTVARWNKTSQSNHDVCCC